MKEGDHSNFGEGAAVNQTNPCEKFFSLGYKRHVFKNACFAGDIKSFKQSILDDRQNSRNHHSSRPTDALRGWPPESHLVGHTSQPTAAREERRNGLITYPRSDDALNNTNGAVLSRPFGEGE